MTSSTWLGHDEKENKYVAIKALTGYYTDLTKGGIISELEALTKMSEHQPQSPHCLNLLSSFTVPGKENADEHMCFVTQLLGGDVKALWHSGNGKRFPLNLAKRILLHLLRGISHAHASGFVHTDLKHDNIFFDTGMSTEEIESWTKSDPFRLHPLEESYDGIVHAAVSQPLPLPSWDDALNRTFVVADFGNAQSISEPKFEEITSLPLRPPEIFLGCSWNEKADIWTYGCLIYEIAVGLPLFKYKANPTLRLDEVESMFHQMLCFSEDEGFEYEQLQHAKMASKYFELTCNLRKRPPLWNFPIEQSIRGCKVPIEKEEDLLSTAAIVQRCLRLDPANRPTAEELLLDPWFAGVD